jgi:hypothetical protein
VRKLLLKVNQTVGRISFGRVGKLIGGFYKAMSN